MKKGHLFFAIVLSLGVVVYVVLSLDWLDVSLTFQSLNRVTLLAAFAIYLINYIFRTLRFKILLDLEDVPFFQLLGVTNLYGMYLYLMPAKFGEVTFPLLLKRRLKVDISTSTGVLVVARLFDFFSIAVILILVLFNYWEIIPGNMQILSIVFCGLVAVVFILFLWMVRNPARVKAVFERKEAARPIVQKTKDFVEGVYQGARTVEANRRYTALVFLSLLIWFCVNSNFFLITVSLGYSFNFFQIIVVSIIMIPVTLFPIQGFANIGAHEIGWITAFTLFDYPYQTALNIAISSHIIYVMFVLLLGLIGVLLMVVRKPDTGLY